MKTLDQVITFSKNAFVAAIKQQMRQDAKPDEVEVRIPDTVTKNESLASGLMNVECVWFIPRPVIEDQVHGVVCFKSADSASVWIRMIQGGAMPRFPHSWSEHSGISSESDIGQTVSLEPKEQQNHQPTTGGLRDRSGT